MEHLALRLCVYIYIYIYMCVYIYIYTHTHIHTSTHIYTHRRNAKCFETTERHRQVCQHSYCLVIAVINYFHTQTIPAFKINILKHQTIKVQIKKLQDRRTVQCLYGDNFLKWQTYSEQTQNEAQTQSNWNYTNIEQRDRRKLKTGKTNNPPPKKRGGDILGPQQASALLMVSYSLLHGPPASGRGVTTRAGTVDYD